MASVLSRIQIILEANTANYNNELRRARQETDSTFTKMKKGAAKMAIGAGVALAGLGVTSLKVAGNFEAAMGGVQAVSNATGKDFDNLREKAKELGATTAYSATEAANGMEFLAMAGMNTEQVLATIPHALSLASAGNIELAQSADIMSNIMTGMGLGADQAQRAADVLASAASGANVDIAMLGESMKYAAPIAKQLGLSLEATAASVGVLGNAGIQGSEAGTALRSIYTRLATHKKAKTWFDTLGLSITDGSGKLKDMVTIFKEMEKASEGMSAQDKLTMFKDSVGTESMSALGVTMDAITDGSLDKLLLKLEDSEGAAKRMADIRMSGLNGELKGLSSAWEGFLIELSDGGALAFAATAVKGLSTGLRDMTKGLPEAIANFKAFIDNTGLIEALTVAWGVFKLSVESVIDMFNSVGDWIQQHEQLAKVLEAVGLAVGVVAGALAIYATLQVIATAAAGAFFGLIALATSPITLVILALTALTAAGIYLYQNWDSVKGYLGGIWSSIKDTFSSAIDSIVAYIDNFVETFKTRFNGLIDIIGSVFTGIKDSISSFFTNIINGVAADIESIKTAFSTGFNNIKSIVTTVFNTIKSIFTSGFNVIKAVATTALNTVKAIFNTAMNIIKAVLKGDIQGIKTAFSSGMSQVANAVKTGVTNIVSAFKTLGTKLYTIGKDVMQGFINGIKEKFTSAINTAKGFVDSIKNVFTRAKGLDIHSPSRVTKEYGKNTGDGFTIGLQSTIGSAIAVADTLVSGIKASFDLMKGYELIEDKENLNKAIFEANKSVIGSIQSLRKEIVLFGNDSKLAAFEYEVAFGSLKNASKEYLDEYRKGLIEIERLEANDTASKALAKRLEGSLEIKEANEKNYNLLKDSFMTEEEKRLELLKEQLAIITAMGDAGSNDVVSNVLKGFGKLTDFVSIIDKSAGQTESQKQTTAFNANVKSSEDEYTGQRNALQGALYSEDSTVEQKRLIQEQLTALEAEQSLKRRQYALDEAEIAKTAMQERLDFTGSVYSDMTSLVTAFTGENSRASKAMFAVQKAHTIAMILLKAKESMAVAMASAPFPANVPAMGMVALKTGVLVAQASGLTGQAHDGLSNVPKEGTYLLDKNERVVRPSDNNKLTKFLDSADKGGTGNTITTNVTISGNNASVESNNSMGKELGNAINAAIQKQLRTELKQGGMLSR